MFSTLPLYNIFVKKNISLIYFYSITFMWYINNVSSTKYNYLKIW